MQTSVASLTDDVLGRCESFEERQVGGERFNFFNGCPNAKTCTPCAVGKQSDAGSAECQACPAGKAGLGCAGCAPGRYRTSGMTNSTACAVCPRGYYQNNRGQAGCLPCAPGQL